MQMKGQLPEKIREVRERSGGSLLDGLIRFVEPEKLEPILKAGYRHKGEAAPFAITAFGDILTWEEEEQREYICKVSFRRNVVEVLTSGTDYFFEDLTEDPQYAGKHFETALFAEVKKKLGILSNSECYGFIPLEGLGGSTDIAHIKKVQYTEYLLLLIQFGGGIDQT